MLCRTGGGEEEEKKKKGIRVEKIAFGDGSELVNDSVVHPEQLAQGIVVSCDEQLFQDSVRNQQGRPNPVCRVTLDLPWPTTDVEREQWNVSRFGVMGFITMTLAADVNADNNEIFWRPATKPPSEVQPWLAEALLAAVEQQTHGQITRLLARLTLAGNYIWGPDREPELYLDGDTFGAGGGDHVDARLPSGDRRRGGDLEMWFWLGRD